MTTKVGIIADTHGLLRPEAIEFLNTCDLILHSGDMGTPEILQELRSIAPTFAVRGNMDKGAWARDIPEREVVEIEKKFFYLIHSLGHLDLDPTAAGFDVVISGHSHQPESHEKEGVLYFNPGSAGPRRFRLPVTIGRITIRMGVLENELITLIK